MAIFIGLVLGIAIGWGIKVIADGLSSAGAIYIYNSEQDEKPYMFLAISGGIEKFFRRRYVVLKIEFKDKPPQD